MPPSHDPHRADDRRYDEGYGDGRADADRSHRHDVWAGLLIGVVATCLAIRSTPWLFRHFFGP